MESGTSSQGLSLGQHPQIYGQRLQSKTVRPIYQVWNVESVKFSLKCLKSRFSTNFLALSNTKIAKFIFKKIICKKFYTQKTMTLQNVYTEIKLKSFIYNLKYLSACVVFNQIQSQTHVYNIYLDKYIHTYIHIYIYIYMYIYIYIYILNILLITKQFALSTCVVTIPQN